MKTSFKNHEDQEYYSYVFIDNETYLITWLEAVDLLTHKNLISLLYLTQDMQDMIEDYTKLLSDVKTNYKTFKGEPHIEVHSEHHTKKFIS
jgi:hypothetical protein